MKSTKPSPGPWTIDETILNTKHQVCVRIGLVADNDNWGWADVHGAKAQANANLIAVVPELLDLLNRAKNKLLIYHKQTSGVYEDGEALQFLINDIEAAIAKAEGSNV